MNIAPSLQRIFLKVTPGAEPRATEALTAFEARRVQCSTPLKPQPFNPKPYPHRNFSESSFPFMCRCWPAMVKHLYTFFPESPPNKSLNLNLKPDSRTTPQQQGDVAEATFAAVEGRNTSHLWMPEASQVPNQRAPMKPRHATPTSCPFTTLYPKV